MPHVIFDKKIDLEAFSNKFQPIIKKGDEIIRLQDVFVNKKKDVAFIQTIVIDDLHQEFMMEIDTFEGKTTLRLNPNTDPEKTNGVKLALGLASLLILGISPDTRIVRTNIEQFIPRRIIDTQKTI